MRVMQYLYFIAIEEKKGCVVASSLSLRIYVPLYKYAPFSCDLSISCYLISVAVAASITSAICLHNTSFAFFGAANFCASTLYQMNRLAVQIRTQLLQQ